MRAGEKTGGGMRKARPGRSGFTLLELLVSLSILAAIAAFIAVAFRLAGLSIERGEAEVSGMMRLRAAIGIVERAVRSADPMPFPSREQPLSYFVGESNRVRFLSAAPPSAGPGKGFRLLCFFEAEGDAGSGLALSESSPFRAEGAFAWEGTQGARVFLPGAARLSLSYSPGPSKEGVWEWEESWDVKEKGRLPAAVRVEFDAQAENGAEAKTAFVVPVPAGGTISGAGQAVGVRE